MAFEDGQGGNTFDELVGDTAQAANSVDAEISALQQKLGWNTEQDISLQQAKRLVEKAERQPQAQEPTLGQRIKGTAKFAGEAVKGMASGLKDVVTEGIPAMVKNPSQALAGGLDVLSNVGNAGIEAVGAFESWKNGNGFHWKHLSDKDRVDLGSYIADKPLTEQERRARDTSNFLTKFTAFIGASVATGGLASVAGGGALATTAAAGVGGGAVGFLAFDPNEDGMAELAQKDPAVRNWLIDWFAGDENDTAFEGRMKNAVGAIMGDAALGAAFFSVAKIAKLRRGLKAAPVMDDVATAAAKVADEVPTAPAAAVDEAVSPGIMDEAALAKAEVANADEAAKALPEGAVAAQAPDLTVKGTGKPFGVEFEETAKNLTPDQVRYGPLSQDEFLRLSKVANLEKRGILAGDDPRAIVKFDTVEALEKLRGKPVDTDSQVAGAIKILKDPEELAKLQTLRKNGSPPNRFQMKALGIMEELTGARVLELADEVISTAGKEGAALSEAKLAQAITDNQYWSGFAEGGASEAAATLQASQRLGVEGGAAAVRKLMLTEDMRKLTLGDTTQVQRLAKTIRQKAKEGAPDVEHAGGVLAGTNLPEPLKKALQMPGKIIDNVVAVNIQLMLSGVKTMFVNVGSGAINIASRQLQKATAGVVGKFSKSKFTMTDDLFKEYFPNVKASQLGDAAKADLFKQIEQIENFHNVVKVNPDVDKFFDGLNDIQAFTDGVKDTLRLKWLASDGKYIPNTSSKFGNIVRTVKEADLMAMGVGDRTKYLAAQFKNQPTQPVTTFMAMQDSMVGNVQAVMEHRGLARKFAKANAKNAEHAGILYKQMMENPPEWMLNMVKESMEEVNFSREFDPKVSKVFGNLEKTLNNIPYSRAIVPFIRVNMNALDQAIQHTPAAMFSGRFRAALKEGGYARQMAMARVINGHAVGLVGAGLAATGVVVGAGPRNPVARKAWEQANPGIKPYSIRNPLHAATGEGPAYLDLRLWQGLGQVFKFASEVYEIGAYVDESNEKDYENLILTGLAATADFFDPDFLTDETAKLTDFLENPSGKQAKKYLATKLVPGVGLGRGIVRGDIPFVEGVDPIKRNIDANVDNPTWDTFEMMWNNFKSTIPGLSDTLPAQRNLWGKPVQYGTPGLGPETTSPLYTDADSPETRDVEKEIYRLGMSGPIFNPEAPEGEKYLTINPLPKYITYEGVKVDLNPFQYENFQRLAAGDYTILAEKKLLPMEQAKEMSKNNLHATLKQVVSSDAYKAARDQTKRAMIKEQIQIFRATARELLLDMDPELQFKQTLGALDQQKAEVVDPAAQEEIENQKQMLIRSRGAGVGVPSL